MIVVSTHKIDYVPCLECGKVFATNSSHSLHLALCSYWSLGSVLQRFVFCIIWSVRFSFSFYRYSPLIFLFLHLLSIRSTDQSFRKNASHTCSPNSDPRDIWLTLLRSSGTNISRILDWICRKSKSFGHFFILSLPLIYVHRRKFTVLI